MGKTLFKANLGLRSVTRTLLIEINGREVSVKSTAAVESRPKQSKTQQSADIMAFRFWDLHANLVIYREKHQIINNNHYVTLVRSKEKIVKNGLI